MDPSDSSPGAQVSVCTLTTGCGRYPLRTRSPVFSAFPSWRAVPATPGEQTGAFADYHRPVLPSPTLQRLGLTISLYEATHGFSHITARHFAASGRAPCGIPVPLLPDTSRRLAGDLASHRRFFLGWTPFIPLGQRRFTAHGEGRGEGGAATTDGAALPHNAPEPRPTHAPLARPALTPALSQRTGRG